MRAKKIEKLNLGFNIGDCVALDNNQIYQSYTQFVNRHKKYAARYQYKRGVKNDTGVLTVLGVYPHVKEDRWDKNKYVVVVTDRYKRIYLVGELGVKRL